MRWEFCSLFRIAWCNLCGISSSQPVVGGLAPYLRYERDQLPKILSLFVRIEAEYLTNAVVVVPLLQKLVPVRGWVSFDEILQLW